MKKFFVMGLLYLNVSSAQHVDCGSRRIILCNSVLGAPWVMLGPERETFFRNTVRESQQQKEKILLLCEPTAAQCFFPFDKELKEEMKWYSSPLWLWRCLVARFVHST